MARNCESCGAVLTSEESIKRHRGEKCHIEWLEKRITHLEDKERACKIALDVLSKRITSVENRSR